jgi:hypothetical protein
VACRLEIGGGMKWIAKVETLSVIVAYFNDCGWWW